MLGSALSWRLLDLPSPLSLKVPLFWTGIEWYILYFVPRVMWLPLSLPHFCLPLTLSVLASVLMSLSLFTLSEYDKIVCWIDWVRTSTKMTHRARDLRVVVPLVRRRTYLKPFTQIPTNIFHVVDFLPVSSGLNVLSYVWLSDSQHPLREANKQYCWHILSNPLCWIWCFAIWKFACCGRSVALLPSCLIPTYTDFWHRLFVDCSLFRHACMYYYFIICVHTWLTILHTVLDLDTCPSRPFIGYSIVVTVPWQFGWSAGGGCKWSVWY